MQAHQLERDFDIAMAVVAAEEILTGKKVTKWGGNDYINAVKMAAQRPEQIGKKLDDAYFVDLNAQVDETSGRLFLGAFLDEFGAHVRQLMQRSHIWACVEAVASQLLKKSVLDSQQVTEIISKTWNEKKGDHQELVLKRQRSSNIQRPWGESIPE